ncbi:MAG TPA: selenium metabolism-associated LysR family transcriptional regulator [Syntrophorhabdaceae bacterium]|nr:selenium metabolism-associated LysR family transcriptional regulator [Syntrophorhabdaceae bacterium]
MELRHIETFLKIAELRSFTKAADELCITQPTASKQIVDLERFFDVRLIDRTKRTVTLTKAGEIFIKYARDIMSLKRDTIEAIDSFKGLKKGKMTIGASTIPGIYILPGVLSDFKDRYSGIRFELTISDTKNIVDLMEAGALDIGIVGSKNETGKLEYKKFIDDTIIVIAPPDYPGTITFSQLKDHLLISRERGSATRNTFELAVGKLKNFRKNELNIIAELSDNEAIKEAVKSGMGMAYISKMAVKAELASGTLREVTIQGLPDIKRSFYIITRKGKTILPQVKALVEIIDKWRKHEKA